MKKQRSPKRLVIILSLIVVAMFGFGYALVPMYNTFCKVLGINGKTGGQVAVDDSMTPDESRWVTIQFLSTRNSELPWAFYPVTKKVKIHPGQSTRITYFARNDTDKTMTVQAIPSISPGIAAKYFKKTECFCFRQQTFTAHQGLEMPVIFYIDKHLPKEVNTITLSYTMFDVGQYLKKE